MAWAESTPTLGKKTAIVWAARVLPFLSGAGIVGSAWFGLPSVAWGVPIALSVLLNLTTRTETTLSLIHISEPTRPY